MPPPLSKVYLSAPFLAGSMHALVASPFKSAYNAAKHGIAGFTKTAALEVRPVWCWAGGRAGGSVAGCCAVLCCGAVLLCRALLCCCASQA